MNGEDGINIGGMNLPRWSIFVVVGGVLAAILISRRNTTTDQSDTSSGLLAAELDQRLAEQWNRWQQWFEAYINEPVGPVDPPGGGCKVNADCGQDTCAKSYTCVQGTCLEALHQGGCPPGDNIEWPVPECGAGTHLVLLPYPHCQTDNECLGWDKVCPSGEVWSAEQCRCISLGGPTDELSNLDSYCPAGQFYDKALGSCIGYPIPRDADPLSGETYIPFSLTPWHVPTEMTFEGI